MVRRIDASRHYETPDPTPVAMPSGFKRPETLEERIRRLVRSERFNQDLDAAGLETFAEANDFDIPDDPLDPSTPYEPFFDPALGHEVTPEQVLRDQAEIREATAKRVEAAKAASKPKPEVPATPLPATPPDVPES